MELIKGYKQTEFGLIPEDWDYSDIGSKIDLLTGYPFPSKKYSAIGIRLLRGSNVKRGKTDWSEEITQYWPIITADIKRYSLDENDIVVAMDGSLVGRSFAQLSKSDLPSLLLQRVARIRTDKIYIGYLKELICSEYFTKYCNKVKTSSAIPHISPKDINGYRIPIPSSIKEQTSIANALSDADAYITSLEKLIEKKHQIKQGAMQELLMPKDGWAWKKLGDIGKTYGGLSGKSKDDFKDGVFPYIPFMNIMTNPVIDLEFLDFVNLKTGESQNSAQKGDLFFNGSSETPEEVGMCSILQGEVPNLYLNSFCFGYRLKKELNINGLYLTYYFRSKEGRKLFYSMAQGATRYNLSKSNFNRLEVPMPAIEEQNFIANTLRDMDFDIKLHEEKLDKARSIKQGMMQQLLTGKIRLK